MFFWFFGFLVFFSEMQYSVRSDLHDMLNFLMIKVFQWSSKFMHRSPFYPIPICKSRILSGSRVCTDSYRLSNQQVFVECPGLAGLSRERPVTGSSDPREQASCHLTEATVNASLEIWPSGQSLSRVQNPVRIQRQHRKIDLWLPEVKSCPYHFSFMTSGKFLNHFGLNFTSFTMGMLIIYVSQRIFCGDKNEIIYMTYL